MLGKAIGKHAVLCLLAITHHVCTYTYTALLYEVMLHPPPSPKPRLSNKKSNVRYGKLPFKLLVQNNVHCCLCPYCLPDIEGKSLLLKISYTSDRKLGSDESSSLRTSSCGTRRSYASFQRRKAVSTLT